MEEDKKIQTLRPTKKQKELLSFIEQFIQTNGYSPSYREIMRGLNYTSVATVALHINSLIKRGHLVKRENSARSLEVLSPSGENASIKIVAKQLKTSEAKWLIDKVEAFFKEAEASKSLEEAQLDRLHILCGALKVLGAEGAASGFSARLSKLKKHSTDNQYEV